MEVDQLGLAVKIRLFLVQGCYDVIVVLAVLEHMVKTLTAI